MKIFLLLTLILGIIINTSSAQNKTDESQSHVSEMTMHVIPQAHIDLAWWWRYDPETIHIVVKHTLETAFNNMEKYPDYTFTFLQVPAIEPLEELYPELFYKLRYYAHYSNPLGERIRNPGAIGTRGRLAIGSGLWCEVDGCLPCGESLVRQCLYGKRYYKYQFGLDVRTAWFQDAWTHPWTYPQILKKSGIDSYMFARPRNVGEQMFWWQSPDGSRVFAYKPFKYAGENLPSQEEINNRLISSNKQYGVRDDVVLIGVGNHGGGAIKADVEKMQKIMAERQSQKPMGGRPARLIFSTPSQFVGSVMDNKHHFPVVNYELIPTIRGAYTTVGEIKKGNRYSENLLMTIEKFSIIASLLNEIEYPRTTIGEAWKKVMLNQFHDTISGTDIPPSIDDALRRYQYVLKIGKDQLNKSLQAIAQRINTVGEGRPIIVFNPLSWQRTEIVEVEIELPHGIHGLQLRDNQGNMVPTQILNLEKTVRGGNLMKLLFLAESVPSLGFKCYWAKSSERVIKYHTTLQASNHEIENEFFKIQIDPSSGCLIRVYDKQFKQEILDTTSKANMIQIIEDSGDSEGFLKSPDGASEHNIWTGRSWNVDSNAEIELIEKGPVRVVLQIKKKFKLARFIQRIIIYPKIRRIDFDLVINWSGKNKMIKVSFPLRVKNPHATYEIPYGTIQRPSEGEEHVAQKWVDVSEKNYGVSLLNDSRYGHDITENVIRLSILRSPEGPAFATDEKDIHQIKYALYPHQGSWQEANVMQKGYEFNYPLIAVVDSVHAGDLPAVYSFLNIEPENLIVTVLKKAEDSEDLIMRFYETNGENCLAKITLSDFLSVDAIHKTDLIENPLDEIDTDGKHFEVPVGKYSIESFKLIKDIY